MSILGTMMSKILGKAPAAVASPAGAAVSAPQAAAPTSAPSAAPAGKQTVDVAAVLDALKEKAPQELNWKTSIVDLMKLLSMDSNLKARKELAKELHFEGDTDDTAKMNVWLHGQIMKKLAENGGKLPNDIKPG